MSPVAALHAQLASIMEVLANTAVAEICELVDTGYSVLHTEISRSRKENEALRRRLRLMELRAARATAQRAAAAASGNAPPLATGRARAQPPAHRPGNRPGRNGTPQGEALLSRASRASNQEAGRRGDTAPSSDPGPGAPPGPLAAGETAAVTTAVIKVEEDDESWSQSDQRDQRDQRDQSEEFSRAADRQMAPPPPTKQEVADEGGGVTRSWVSEEVSSTSVSLSSGRRADGSGYDGELQLASVTTHNPLSEDPGCSYVLNAGPSVPAPSDSGRGGFPFSVGEVTPPAGFQKSQQRAAPPPGQSQLPVREEPTGRPPGRWRPPPGGVSRASGHGRDDGGGGGGRTFVCTCCGKTLACLKNLKTHMRVHTGEKPFVCALCGKRFSDSSNLKRHQSVHTGEKRYGCVHCGKRFAQSGSLKVHMSVHSDCKQFRCSRCGKTFISGSHLRRHVAMHAAEKRPAPTPL